MKVVVHGGMHKTATTSLQSMMHKNRERLLQLGIFYPNSGGIHHDILLNVKRPDWNPEKLNSQLLAAENSKADLCFLSAEVVSTLSRIQFAALNECFNNYNTVYVFCFRHWVEFLPSRWAQYSRRRDTQSFDHYLDYVTSPSNNHINCKFTNVLRLAEGYKKIGISFQNAIASPYGVVGTILRSIDFSNNLISELSSQPVHLNRRLDWATNEIIRLLNGIVADRLSLPQNDLSNSACLHKQCDVFFDLGEMISQLKSEIIGELRSCILTHKKTKTFSEMTVFETENKMLLNNYKDCFFNLYHGKIFPDKLTTEITFADIGWQEFEQLNSHAVNKVIKHVLPALTERKALQTD